MERTAFKLNDDVIAQVARVLQICMLTGTDIVDHLRQLRLEEKKGGGLSMTAEYVDHEKQIIDKMFDELGKKLTDSVSPFPPEEKS